MSEDARKQIAIGIFTALVSALIVYAISSNLPVDVKTVPNRKENAVDIEFNNPSTTSHLVTEVRFYPQEKVPIKGDISNVDQATIIFDQTDYDDLQRCYRQTVNGVQIDAANRLNVRFVIRDSGPSDWYVGRLEIDYGERENPSTIVIPDHPIQCSN